MFLKTCRIKKKIYSIVFQTYWRLQVYLLTHKLLMKPYILLVDDDADDIMLLKDAIVSANDYYTLHEAHDGRMALDFLHSIKAERLPCLIVLDINMPVLNGRELLAIMKSDEELKDVPVIFFTTSSHPEDVKYAAQFNVELITKPFNLSLLSEAAKKIITFCNA